MHFVVAPDKFKGSLTSFQVCDNIKAGILTAVPQATVQCFPMADGGDGFSEVMQFYLGSQTISIETVDPLHRPLRASYQWSESSKTAIVELASASGLQLLQPVEQNPLKTSTYGTGLMVQAAIKKGAKKIILGLGGSATNDGGLGILKALGFQILNKSIALEPTGEQLSHISHLLAPEMLPDVEFTIACDVQNVLFGQSGAAYVYAPQKGASKVVVEQLDNGLRNLHRVLLLQTGKNVAVIPGTGAAGGIAAPLIAFFGARLQSGINMVLQSSKLSQHIKPGTVVFTGEGKMDEQTGQGKVVGSIAALAKSRQAIAIALCGSLQLPPAAIHQLGLQYATSICNGPLTLDDAVNDAPVLLQHTTANVCSLLAFRN